MKKKFMQKQSRKSVFVVTMLVRPIILLVYQTDCLLSHALCTVSINATYGKHREQHRERHHGPNYDPEFQI